MLAAAEVEAALPMASAIDVMAEAFAALSSGAATVPQRLALPLEADSAGSGAVGLVMPATSPKAGLAVKVLSVVPENPSRGKPAIQGLVLLQETRSGAPVAVLEGAAVTALRTGAAAGLATRLLAPPDARTGLVVGAGGQARSQILALDAARALEVIGVFNRTQESAEALVARVAGEVEARLEVVADLAPAVRQADVVTTVTSAGEPVLFGSELPAGCHVNAIGSFTPGMRELDIAAVARARVFMDSPAAALEEAGELIAAVAAGESRPAVWTQIGDVAAGRRPGRRSADEITLFKSVGHAVQDLYAAAAVYDACAKRDLGVEVRMR